MTGLFPQEVVACDIESAEVDVVSDHFVEKSSTIPAFHPPARAVQGM